MFFLSLLFLFAFFTEENHLKTGRSYRSPGDWVRMGDREHGAKGLCQERALVSGLEVGVLDTQQKETWDPNLEDGEDGWDDGFSFFFFTLSVFEVVGTKWFVSMLKPFGYFDFLVIKWDAWPLGLLPV